MFYLKEFTRLAKGFFNFGDDRIPEEDVVTSISSDIEFKGPKLWLLIIAVLLASLGLNINSTAVIIGAMLISPLMGPLLGLGLGIAIYDFSILKRASVNFFTATLFSVITATIYFSITPITQAQSELLARTSPTIYDVCIALFGGLAGILAQCCKSQRFGNVIPGVAIATALMPPLCTAGYGLATGNLHYAIGAIYLYIINTVFITFATTLFIAFVLKFKKKSLVDKGKEKKLRKAIIYICIVTMVPSIFLTLGIVQDTIFEQRVNLFIHEEMNHENSQVIRYKADARERTIQVLMLGQRLDSTRLDELNKKLPSYKLENVKLNIVQGDYGLRRGEMIALLSDYEKHNIVSINTDIQALLNGGEIYSIVPISPADSTRRLGPFTSEINNSSLSRENGTDSETNNDVPVTIYILNMNKSDKERIDGWFNQQFNADSICMEVYRAKRVKNNIN